MGPLSVLVTGERAVVTAERSPKFLKNVDPTEIRKGTPNLKKSLEDEHKESTKEKFEHGNTTRCRETTMEGETTDVANRLPGVKLSDGAKRCIRVGTGRR